MRLRNLVFGPLLPMMLLADPLEALPIDDIPNLVRQKNRDVAAAENDFNAADSAETASYAPLFPKIELKNSYTRLDNDIVIDAGPQRIEKEIAGVVVGLDIDPPPIKVQDKNIFNSHLLLTQPIYAGGRISAGMDAATAQKNEAALNLDGMIEEKTVEALQRYFQVVLTTRVSAILQNVLGDLERMESLANSLVTRGMTAKFSLLQIGVAKADLLARLEEARNKSKLADLAFKVSTGLEMTQPIVYDSGLKKIPLTLGLDVFKTQSIAKRREFSLLKSKATQVSALRSAETGKMLPTAYLFGKRELLEDQLTALQPKWAVGVGIDIPITAGISQFPERNRAMQLESKVETLRAKALHEIPLQVESYYSSVKSLDASIEALEAGLVQAKEAARLAEVRFGAGSGSSLEILKAQTDSETMMVKKLLALEEYNRKLIDLYRSAGDASGYLQAYRTAPLLNKE